MQDASNPYSVIKELSENLPTVGATLVLRTWIPTLLYKKEKQRKKERQGKGMPKDTTTLFANSHGRWVGIPRLLILWPHSLLNDSTVTCLIRWDEDFL